MPIRARILTACAVVALVVSFVAQASAASVAADPFEPDDTQAGARDLTDQLPYYGAQPLGQSRTLSESTDREWDEDWVCVDVTQAEVDTGLSYLFEAWTARRGVEPVVEVYGPGWTTARPPDDKNVLKNAGFDPGALDAGGSAFFAAGGGSVSLFPSEPGRYYARARPSYDQDSPSAPGAYALRVKVGQATRIAGADRVLTSVAASRERYPDGALAGGSVVVASGYGFADALAGSTLAGALESPLLLTHPDGLQEGLASEIRRLGADEVVLLGGPGAVSRAVESAIAVHTDAEVTRIAGPDRYETARLIAEETATRGDTATLAFVVNGYAFPDALSASPMAASNSAPVLLTGVRTLSEPAEAVLADPELGITDVVIVGGTSVVSASVEARIASLLGGAGHVFRTAGNDRYETSRTFALWASQPWRWAGIPETGDVRVGTPADPAALSALWPDRYGIACGDDFPDALSGGVFCGLADAPILLTPRTSVSPWLFDLHQVLSPGSTDYYTELVANGRTCGRTYVFGGPSAVSGDVMIVVDAITGR